MEQNPEKNATFFRFEDLRVYHKSLEYVVMLHQTLRNIPEDQKEILMIPFFDAARQIVNHVAEGSSRDKSQFINFLKSAKNAVRECLIFTTIAKQLGYFTESENQQSRQMLMELTKMIGALISSLIRSGVKESPSADYTSDDDSFMNFNE